MRFRYRALLVFSFAVICLVFYVAVNKLVLIHSSENDSLEQVIEQQSILAESQDDTSRSFDIHHASALEQVPSGGLVHSEEVSIYARSFIEAYHQAHPTSYPVVAGQADLFGNVWMSLMWDGERSEIILIYYDEHISEIKQKTITFTKEEFSFYNKS